MVEKHCFKGCRAVFFNLFWFAAPYKTKKLCGTLPSKTSIKWCKFNILRHPWHLLTAPLRAAALRLGITDAKGEKIFCKQHFFTIKFFTKADLNGPDINGTLFVLSQSTSLSLSIYLSPSLFLSPSIPLSISISLSLYLYLSLPALTC